MQTTHSHQDLARAVCDFNVGESYLINNELLAIQNGWATLLHPHPPFPAWRYDISNA